MSDRSRDHDADHGTGGRHGAWPGQGSPQQPEAGIPEFGARRLLYIGSGALSAAHLPFWVNWLRAAYPGLELRVLLTRSAERFVAPGALAALSGREVVRDVWPQGPVVHAPHVELAEWADAVVVHPASFHFMSRLALGLADTPAMLALQCTRVPVALAPSLPPGALESPAYRSHHAALSARDNVIVVPPVRGVSTTTGRADAALAAPLPDALRALEVLRSGALSGAGPGAPAGTA
ncbi:flavoprotein [Streptomyces bacillaris]|uniref:flavoprotein n=1 Tax=Streptomyces bacillaris TaxID=68179 RepID=UPI00381B8DB8